LTSRRGRRAVTPSPARVGAAPTTGGCAARWRWRRRRVARAAAGTGAALFQQLGIDLDAMRHAPHALPEARPSAGRGAALDEALPDWLSDGEARRALAPRRLPPPARGIGAQWAVRWGAVNLVAMPAEGCPEEVWRARLTCISATARRVTARRARETDLPVRRCRGCVRWTRPCRRPGRSHRRWSDALSQRRAAAGQDPAWGMGTGMPEFGSLYSDAEMWDMVAYLRTFLFAR